jgi:hypothetical protein
MRELGNYPDALHAYHKAAIHLPGSIAIKRPTRSSTAP